MKSPTKPAKNVPPNVPPNVPREPNDVETLTALCMVRAQDPFNAGVTQAIEKLARRIAEKVLAS